jgi:hypothetical protein
MMVSLFNNESALKSLLPLAEYFIKPEGIVWLSKDITQPTQIELDAEILRLQEEYDSLSYKRDRKYPSWEEQADMQYWDAINGTTTWLDAIQVVKDKYPKPEQV